MNPYMRPCGCNEKTLMYGPTAPFALGDWLLLQVVMPLPDGVHMFCVMDCCHSGSIMDLPFEITVTPELAQSVKMIIEEEKLNPGSAQGIAQLETDSTFAVQENPSFKKLAAKYMEKHKSVLAKMAMAGAAGAAAVFACASLSLASLSRSYSLSLCASARALVRMWCMYVWALPVLRVGAPLVHVHECNFHSVHAFKYTHRAPWWDQWAPVWVAWRASVALLTPTKKRPRHSATMPRPMLGTSRRRKASCRIALFGALAIRHVSRQCLCFHV